MNINDALRIKNKQRIKLLDEAKTRRDELHARIPRVAQIDKQIESFAFRLIGGEKPEILRAESATLNSERERLLAAAGYPVDYDEPQFECKDCNDSGYCDDLKICQCVKNLVTSEQYQQSTLAGGLVGKTFENFSLSYYNEANGERKRMEDILNGCRRYADNFPSGDSAGLLFTGGTGLGKTHMSAAIANRIASKGFSVVYESAQQIVDTYDAVRFNRIEFSERKKYETCSLLIIDDLGAECMTQYSVSALTSLIDLRIVNGKKTIISSNLATATIQKTYGERLYSRLLGEFILLKFVGKDIRMQKLKGANN